MDTTYGRLQPAREPARRGPRLLEIADILRSAVPQDARVAAARDPELRALMEARPDRSAVHDLRPSAARDGRSGARAVRRVVRDVPALVHAATRRAAARSARPRRGCPTSRRWASTSLYLPPIHPIGRTHRKGRNNSLTAAPGDPGSPWAIGADEGGHTAIEPGLGTLDDFDRFVGVAKRLGLEVALDIAFQASPDHPWVREHPEWFRHRPDGTIKYAENPPKKYQDIYPLDFESADWRGALGRRCATSSCSGSRTACAIFRVDNPHTKPFRFWEWCIAEVKREHPGRDLPGRGVHAAEGDALPREGRLHAVVHLLHLAQHARTSCASTSPS